MPDRMPSILKKIVEKKRRRLEELKIEQRLLELKYKVKDMPDTKDFIGAIRNKNRVNIIAELKRMSPSKGIIRKHFDILKINRAYHEGGADAISIVTEEDFFDGSLEYIRKIRNVTEKPILRKDFIFDPYQVYEAREAGSDSVLLIASILSENQLKELLELSKELGMSALVEVHSKEELMVVLETDAEIIGINNRNLHTFKVNPAVAIEINKHIPDGRVVVSESGIQDAGDIKRLLDQGIYAFLIGEYFMRADNIKEAVRELKNCYDQD